MSWLDGEGQALYRALEAVLAAGTETPLEESAFESLAVRILRWQRSRCPVLARVLSAMDPGSPQDSLATLLGAPTDAFREGRIATFDAAATVRTFRTSGTTGERRGEHHFADLTLYTRGSLQCAERWLTPGSPWRFLLLAEGEQSAPHSSLSFMLARIAEAHPDAPTLSALRDGSLDVPALDRFLAEGSGPVAMLGATFAFVHLLDGQSFRLPRGSVVMPTGGFKGRSRVLEPAELFTLLSEGLGVERAQVVQEYGMTELSSQAWEAHREGVPAGRYVCPPWMRVDAVDPLTLAPLPRGATGLLRVLDLLNLGSCIALQTADLGTVYEQGFEVHGRAPGATPRGCARAIDALLTGAR